MLSRDCRPLRAEAEARVPLRVDVTSVGVRLRSVSITTQVVEGPDAGVVAFALSMGTDKAIVPVSSKAAVEPSSGVVALLSRVATVVLVRSFGSVALQGLPVGRLDLVARLVAKVLVVRSATTSGLSSICGAMVARLIGAMA